MAQRGGEIDGASWMVSGCLAAVGAVGLAAAIGLASPFIKVFFGLPGLVLLAAAFAVLRSARRRAAEAVTAAVARLERGLLQLAARHDGLVSAAQAALEIPGLTVAAARDELERLAHEGFCSLETDDQGRTWFLFPVGQPAPGESPEQWVARQTGQDAEPTRRVDA
jgi:hypothetical protein